MNKRNQIIVVEGTDGAGKSTVIDALKPFLEEQFTGGVHYFHLRPGWLPSIGVLLRKREDDGQTVTNPHAQKPSGLIGSMIRWVYYQLDYSLGYIRKVRPLLRHGDTCCIFDRYYYDYFIDPRRSRICLPHWLLRTGEWIVPHPDVILCLGGEAEKIYGRKPETSLEEVRRQVGALQQLCYTRRQAVWIDTTVPFDQTIASAMAALMPLIRKE